MAGTIRWNFIVGAVSFVLTFLLSLGSNVWLTTLLRSVYSFVILFAVTFGFRFIMGLLLSAKSPAVNETAAAAAEGPSPNKNLGQHLDLTTPDETAQKTADGVDREEAEFAPLLPTKLVTRKQPDTEQSVRALRQMSEE
ncbi:MULTISPECIES: hypothetical protein [unclassified Paenibacillus]|uniref:hypothetical protein n=1 Tax=unclassified Paenibacillus TaxID=185978 RepID=UPI00020D7E3F|nr:MULTISPECIES: hypothetical protein [unclassified Paenibacillus]EGL14670.1 hypothetical protein HMPREF9413_0392 [Paenibacillus sp. HGF7]EPD92046.1 hypothetical protein HMPREF1207_00712 [Paenibacillus sp. HGH0039]